MIRRIVRKYRPKPTAEVPKSPVQILIESGPWRMDVDARTAMTISCKDTDYIPKVPKAGSLTTYKSEDVQIMHNGLKVAKGGYHGDWMANIITTLKGHHEPQEEKAFYEVIERIKKDTKKPTAMIELGSFWAFYSLWFKQAFPKAQAFGFEPDPTNMKVGKKNAKLNDLNVTFIAGAAGSQDGQAISFELDSEPGKRVEATIRSVDAFVTKKKLPKLDILHMDVQGVELDALKGAEELIKRGGLRFLFISTHHYFFSHDPTTHQKCLAFIKEHGGHVITEHNVLESFSGDGLIVASFDERDKDFTIKTSVNHSQHSLFRPYEEDLAVLIEHMEA